MAARNDLQREAWLDGLKGFAILLVILGHVLSGYINAGIYAEARHSFYMLRVWIYSFHMPLFFLLSGFTCTLAYCREDRLDVRRWGRQLLSLVWLYALYGVLQWCVKMAVPSLVNETYTLESLQKMFVEPLGNFWYLYVLVVFYGIAALTRMHRWHPRWLLLAAALSIAALTIHLSRYNLTWYRAQYHFFFFLMGSVLCRFRWPLRSRRVLGCCAMFLATACWFYWFIGIRSWFSNWSFAIALSTSLVLLYTFCRFPRLAGLRLFQLCGKYCMELYLLHTFFTAGLRSLLCQTPLLPWLSVILNFALSTCICLLLAIAARSVWWGSLFFRPARFLSRLKDHQPLRPKP